MFDHKTRSLLRLYMYVYGILFPMHLSVEPLHIKDVLLDVRDNNYTFICEIGLIL